MGVGRRQSLRDLCSDGHDLLLAERSRRRTPAHQLHDEEIDTIGTVIVVNRGDVRMVESRQRQRFLAESFAC